MINFFLKLKHWQLFFLLIGIPILFQAYMLFSMFGSKEANASPNYMMVIMGWFPILMLLFTGLFFGWFWSIAIGLQAIIPSEIKMKTRKFKFFFFFPLVYILFLMSYMAGLFNGLRGSGFYLGDWFSYIIWPLHLFSMFCMFYSMYFVAKTIKTAELKRKVVFGDFVLEFILLWFYIIGIWIIQPRVNQLAKEKNTNILKKTS